MPADGSSPGARLARRRFLGALAAAPAALAGCSAVGAAGSMGGAGPPGAGAVSGAPARAPAPDAATRAVREQPLPSDAEPAFVFRAGAARPGEP
jgi:nitrous oxide reductase